RHRTIYRNQRGEPVTAAIRLFVHAEREASAKAGKNKEIERTQYTPEMLAEIDRLYAEEYVRGAEPRYWEEVEEGEELPTVIKGPLLVTDIISAHQGRGWGTFGVAPLKLGYKNRRRVPKFYTPNGYGVPDVAMRLHWEEDWAQALGHPFAYDYGAMR